MSEKKDKLIRFDQAQPIENLDKPIEECDIEDIKSPKKRKWLAALLETGGGIAKTAVLTGINHGNHYHWLRKDPVYAVVYKKVHERSIIVLEEEARRRAVEGVDEDVYFEGQKVGSRKKYSDNLLMFLMKKRDPSYKDNFQSNQIGIWGGDGKVMVQFNIPRPEDDKALPE